MESYELKDKPGSFAACVFTQADLEAVGASRQFTPQEMDIIASEAQDLIVGCGNYWEALKEALGKVA